MILFPLKQAFILSALSLLLGAGGAMAQAITPFTPPGDTVSYLSFATSNNAFTGLYKTNILSGSRSIVRTPGAVKFNGIGYNVQDNFIYGAYAGNSAASAATPTSQIIKLDANGNYTLLTVANLPSNTYEAGDIDANGNLYLYSSSASTVYKINLAAASLSATAIALSPGGANLADISVNADGTVIWGASNGDGSFVTFTNGTRSTRTAFSGAIPAMTFYDSRKNLFMVSEATGDVYLTNPSGGATDIVVDNPATQVFQGDGAQSRNASVYSNTQPDFECEGGIAYVVSQATENLYQINTQNDDYTLVKADISGPGFDAMPNNMGYDPKDDFLWAYRSGTSQLIRIGSDYSVQYFPIAGLSSQGGYDAGTFADDGIFYLYDGQTPLGVIRRLDLDPNSPTYLQFLADLDITPANFTTTSNIADISLNLKDGKLYGVTSNGSLIRIDTANGQMTSLGKITGPGAATGTANVSIAFIDPEGSLYFQRSSATNMWKVANVHEGNLESTLYKSNLTAHDGGDGARCLMSSFGDGSLAAIFGNISAFIGDGNLQVSWQTLKETNNDYFEIELSKDGRSWTRAGGNISSKATDGNSDISIQYEQSIPLSTKLMIGASFFLLSIGIMLRRNKWLSMVLLIAGSNILLFRCTKETSQLSSQSEKLYVRIKQVDKDGEASYSKIVRAAEK